ncbi:MAG: CoA activase [Eggerthellaceae bacterium]|nr:CoA activase [Eggerthellaceae bacterium]
MYRIGIDIGSTAAKAAVLDENNQLVYTVVMPTGFNGVEAAHRLADDLDAHGYDTNELPTVATGYGRVSVPYADKTITEITCHGMGADYLFGEDGLVIDVGGQDTKAILLADGKVKKFVMNDKCAAGTGKFLEVIADRMGVTQEELADLASQGEHTPISSMCTVFAESEVISLVGRGEPRENIANGVIESVVGRVASLTSSMASDQVFLTGGLCENDYVVGRLAHHLNRPVKTAPNARFAGAIGAALNAGN